MVSRVRIYEIDGYYAVINAYFFFRIRRLLMTLRSIPILFLVYSNLYQIKVTKHKT